MNALNMNALLTRYDEGNLTTKELLGEAFSHLKSHREDIFLILIPLREHSEPAIQELEGKLLNLLGGTPTITICGERAGARAVNE